MLIMEEYLTFIESDLIDQFTLLNFIKTIYPSEKAKIIAHKLMQHIMIDKNQLYLYDHENETYRGCEYRDKTELLKYLITISRKLYSDSIMFIDEAQKYRGGDQFIKNPDIDFSKPLSLSYYEDFVNDIYYMLKNNSKDEYFFHNSYFSFPFTIDGYGCEEEVVEEEEEDLLVIIKDNKHYKVERMDDDEIERITNLL